MHRIVSNCWLPALGALLGLALVTLVRHSLGDDAYITLAYARNLAENGVWGVVPGVWANSATSPLNVLTLALPSLITIPFSSDGTARPVVGLVLQSVVCGALIGWAIGRVVDKLSLPKWVAVAGLLLLLGNPFLASTFGLEFMLVTTAMVWLLSAALDGRPLLYGAVGGLAMLSRLDMIILVLLLAIATAGIRRRFWRSAGVATLVAAPWFIWSWFVLASFIPDTLVIKQARLGEFGGGWNYFTGMVRYYHNDPYWAAMAAAPALLGVVVLLAWAGLRFARQWSDFPRLAPVVALGAAGLVYFVSYSFLGVSQYPWYYLQPMLSIGLAGLLLVSVWLAEARRRAVLRTVAPAVALCLFAFPALGGIATSLQQGVPWPASRATGNWASADEYSRIGRELGAAVGDGTVLGPGEIGTLAYFCQCQIYDEFTNRDFTAPTIIAAIAEANPVEAALLQLNYAHFDLQTQQPPTDYVLVYNGRAKSRPEHGIKQWHMTEGQREAWLTLVPAELMEDEG